MPNGPGRRRNDMSGMRNDGGRMMGGGDSYRSAGGGQGSRGGAGGGGGGGGGHGYWHRSYSDRMDGGGVGGGGGGAGRSGASVMERPMHDRFLFMTMCLIGQTVEVQVKNGSVYQGIFHTANTERDFGVVLKMARLIKGASVKGGKVEAIKDSARKAPIKMLIISSQDFVQIIAKDICLSGDVTANGRPRDVRSNDIITDSAISRNRPIVVEGRELKPWKAEDGEDVPGHLQLDTWNSRRNWDQFAENKKLFGVESTFDENLYTTKLEKGSGPEAREREREAARIAREIELKATRNPHLAEERGQVLETSIGEEELYSSVLRQPEDAGPVSRAGDDVGDDEEDEGFDAKNAETFGAMPAVSMAPMSVASSSTSNAVSSTGAGTTSPDVGRDGGASVSSPPVPSATSVETPTVESLSSPSVASSASSSSSASLPSSSSGAGSAPCPSAAALSTLAGTNSALTSSEDVHANASKTGPSDSMQTSDNPSTKTDSPTLAQRRAFDLHNDLLAKLMRLDAEKKRTKPGSPINSPFGRRSPLLSPKIADASNIHALNLDPSRPQVNDEVIRQFHEFKLQQETKNKSKKREDFMQDLKLFRESLEVRTVREKIGDHPRSPRDTPLRSVGLSSEASSRLSTPELKSSLSSSGLAQSVTVSTSSSSLASLSSSASGTSGSSSSAAPSSSTASLSAMHSSSYPLPASTSLVAPPVTKDVGTSTPTFFPSSAPLASPPVNIVSMVSPAHQAQTVSPPSSTSVMGPPPSSSAPVQPSAPVRKPVAMSTPSVAVVGPLPAPPPTLAVPVAPSAPPAPMTPVNISTPASPSAPPMVTPPPHIPALLSHVSAPAVCSPSSSGGSLACPSPSISPPSPMSSSSGSATSSTMKRSSLNPNAKEFKLNPNAKVFTPIGGYAQPRPMPIVSTPVYMQPLSQGAPMPTAMPAVPQYMPQPMPGQFAQYPMPSYMQPPPTAYVPSTPVGTSGAVPPVLQSQTGMKMPQHTQPQVQVVGPVYHQQHSMRFVPPAHPHAAYIYPNGPQFVPQGVYPQQGVMYVQYPSQQLPIQPQAGPPPLPGHPPPPQPPPQQQPKHRGAAMPGVQYPTTPYIPPQHPHPQVIHHHQQQPPLPPQPPASVSMAGPQPMPSVGIHPGSNGVGGGARVGVSGGKGIVNAY
ncbi:hypothetical protein CBR_g52348 [Chara braunii]|uniref:LsmAD domain-containing protein n=1 Tax=Chara braunii TaxID=69332 RepID=A0A388K6U6_CHABU|nr:hypothetical protein CBR_g52348 [Chara braunii]|eukprot:GBG65757.1 hypothetical protein CBR_g52348 [Chara braunii]